MSLCCDLSHSFLPPHALSPVCPLVPSIPVSYPQTAARRHHQKPAKPPVWPTSKPSLWPTLTVPCIRPIDIVLGHPRLLWTVLVLQPSCALFFRFLSSVSFPSQYATRSLAHLSTILQRAHIGQRTLLPSFSTVPIQSAYLPACHAENHTIRRSGTRLDFRYLACIKFACRTHVVHVLAFGTSCISISPLFSLLSCEFSAFSLPFRLILSLGDLECSTAPPCRLTLALIPSRLSLPLISSSLSRLVPLPLLDFVT